MKFIMICANYNNEKSGKWKLPRTPASSAQFRRNSQTDNTQWLARSHGDFAAGCTLINILVFVILLFIHR